MTVKELSDLLAKLPPDMPIALNDREDFYVHNIGLDIVHLHNDCGDVRAWWEGKFPGEPKPEGVFDACLIDFVWVGYHGNGEAAVREKTIQRIDDYLNAGVAK